VLGVITAIASIFGRLKPSLPPLVASLIVIGWGCIAQNTYGGDVIAVIGIAISAVLFLVSYRRNEALMSAATAVSTGVWAVALTAALTEGSLVPLVVAAALGTAMIAWGAKLTRK
jgi:low temperature requirement protein LtrA